MDSCVYAASAKRCEIGPKMVYSLTGSSIHADTRYVGVSQISCFILL